MVIVCVFMKLVFGCGFRLMCNLLGCLVLGQCICYGCRVIVFICVVYMIVVGWVIFSVLVICFDGNVIWYVCRQLGWCCGICFWQICLLLMLFGKCCKCVGWLCSVVSIGFLVMVKQYLMRWCLVLCDFSFGKYILFGLVNCIVMLLMLSFLVVVVILEFQYVVCKNEYMQLFVMLLVLLMLVKLVIVILLDVLYEFKWDGFCFICFCDGDQVELGSCNEWLMICYFFELVVVIRVELLYCCVIDGEIIIVIDYGLDFEVL